MNKASFIAWYFIKDTRWNCSKMQQKKHKGEEDFKIWQVDFQVENCTDEDIYTEPVPLLIFYPAYHENKTWIMKHCLCQKQ